MEDNRKWCWLASGFIDEAFGPFESKEDAIADARKATSAWALDGFPRITLARCNFADPAEELADGACRLLMEGLEESCDEVLRNPVGPTFELKDEASIDDLDSLIRDWLRKNVKAVWFSCDRDTFETFDLEAG